MVEEKISNPGHEPCNVQVVFHKYSGNSSFELWGESGKFLTVPAATVELASPTRVESAGEDLHEDTESGSSGEEMNELELLCQSVTDITRERDTLCEELETIR